MGSESQILCRSQKSEGRRLQSPEYSCLESRVSREMILNDFCGLGIEKIVENHEKIEILDRLVNFLKFWKNDESVKDFGFFMILNDFCGLGIENIVENHEKTEADIFFSEAFRSRH